MLNVRLDIAVSKGMNHLLKAPFVIHPKTGRVCVPFRVSKVDSFDPEKVGCCPRVFNFSSSWLLNIPFRFPLFYNLWKRLMLSRKLRRVI